MDNDDKNNNKWGINGKLYLYISQRGSDYFQTMTKGHMWSNHWEMIRHVGHVCGGIFLILNKYNQQVVCVNK